MTRKNVSLLHKHGAKRFNIHNMKPFVKLTKKQYKYCTRYNVFYALEYKKRLYRQNLLKSLSMTNVYKNINYFRNLYKIKQLYRKVFISKILAIPYCDLSKYSSFYSGSNLWAIQKQTTAYKVFPQSRSFWFFSVYQIINENNCPISTEEKNLPQKKPSWTAGFVKVRKLRQYYARQLQSTKKYLYWYGSPSFRTYKKRCMRIYNHNRKTVSQIWSKIMYLESLWTNILVKSNFVFNSSASSQLIKRKKCAVNGVNTKMVYTFCKPADLFYKIL